MMWWHIFSQGIIICCFILTACTSLPKPQTTRVLEGQPPNIEDICAIFAAKPLWIEGARTSYEQWNFPIELMMAIIRYESSFIADARPLDAKGERLSSAYGYAQALDGTWKLYKDETQHFRAVRTDFADSIHFVGWYVDKAVDLNDGLSRYDVENIYVLYHDGWSSLKTPNKELSLKLLEVASKVRERTLSYHRQLKKCPHIQQALYSTQKPKDTQWF